MCSDDNDDLRSIFYNNIGMCYIRLEEWEKAKDSYTKALEINEHYLKARKNRIKCYQKLDLYDDCFKEMKIVIQQEGPTKENL